MPLRAIIDDARGESVTFGVVAWDSERAEFQIRALEYDEKVPGFTQGLRQLAEAAVAQLRRWAEKEKVPYSDGPKLPWHSDFWIAASGVLTTAIRIGSPRAIDPAEDSVKSIESLFEAVVQPVQSERRITQRIDGAVTRALGEYAAYFERQVSVMAFHGRKEAVLRRAGGPTGEVIVEAVNLATSTARVDADALVSRMQRIREGEVTRVRRFVIGYISSPGGLNGETDMREWIKRKVTTEVFDLNSEALRFQLATQGELHSAGLLPEDPQLEL